ncbi:MAG: ATP-binding protein [Steroidobacteraceae bacterium]|nr:ATP-binding protein [Steroidobacteraceae bacterium]
MSAPSLRRRILLLGLGSLALGLAAMGGVVYVSAVHEVNELFDAELAESARMLADLRSPGQEARSGDATGPGHPYERKLAFVMRDESGAVLLQSRFGDLADSRVPCQGYDEERIGGVDWKLFCLQVPEQRMAVLVGQQLAIRSELEGRILIAQLVPYLLALPLLGLLTWFAVGRALAPLSALSRQIAGRSARNLEPVSGTDAPEEIEPLVAELNRLLLRVQRTIDDEKRFTADAAHELRTPLAAIRAQTELALRRLPGGDATFALGKVIQGVDRGAHLVDQLLALSRLDHAEEIRRESLALRPLAERSVAQWRERFAAAQVALGVSGDEAARARVDAALVEILLDNLLSNALRHVAAGGRVTIEVGDGALAVEDDGPGIPEHARERVLQRFVRGPDARGTGSGLGLSIVARIAALHGATLSLSTGLQGRGLRVAVDFIAEARA